jgi:ABC-2 type transport system permease protein
VRAALHAEWTKLRTVAGPWWLLAATVAAVSVVRWHSLGLVGTYLGQAPVAVLAVLVVGGEYGTGMIRTTLTAVPRRSVLLAAKAAVLTGGVAAAVAVGVLGSPPRTGVGLVVRLALIALFSLGTATAVRDSATGIGIVLGVLYLFPILTVAVGSPHWQRLLLRLEPTSGGLGVTAGWATAALVTGGLLLYVRDA